MRSLSLIASRHPIAVLVLLFTLSVFGVISWKALPLDLFPDIQSPSIYLYVKAGDKPAQQMERLYAEKVERALFTVPGLRTVEQRARNGELLARMRFDWQTNIDIALVDANRVLARLAADPDIEAFHLRRFDARQAPVMSLGLRARAGGPSLSALRTLAERELAPRLEQLEGIAEVRITGGREQIIAITLDPVRMRAHGVSVQEVQHAISSNNIDFNAGSIEEDEKVLLVQGQSRFQSIEDIAALTIRYIGIQANAKVALTLSDLAQIQREEADIDSLVRVNGEEGVGVFIYKEANSNTVAVSRTVNEALGSIKKTLPQLEFVTISDDATQIEGAITDIKHTALIGVALAIAVLFVFIRSPLSLFVVALSVPVSIAISAFVLRLADQSLNLMTLGGIALGAGMLVDNTIVISESILRHFKAHSNLSEGIERGTSAVSGAIVSSTLSTCIVFLPVLFIEGLAATLFSGLALAVIVSLLASLLVALFLVPAIMTLYASGRSDNASLFQSIGHAFLEPTEAALQSGRYRNFLNSLLRRPNLVLGVSVVVVLISAFFLASLGSTLLPPDNPRQLTLSIYTPPGQRVESTNAHVANVEEILAQVLGQRMQGSLAEVGRRDASEVIDLDHANTENQAQLHVKLAQGAGDLVGLIAKANTSIEALHSTRVDWRASDSTLSHLLGQTHFPIQIDVYGQRLEDLFDASETLVQALHSIPGLFNLKSSFEGASDEMHIRIKRGMAQSMGVDITKLTVALKASLQGVVASDFVEGDETRDIVIKTRAKALGAIEAITLRSETGALYTLGEVAEIQRKPGTRQILRRDQRRYVQVSAQLDAGLSVPDARERVLQTIRGLSLPPGVRAELSGNERERQQAVEEMMLAGGLAFLLVFMVLAGSFESLRLASVVILSVPTALIGVACVLAPQFQPLGLLHLLGLVILMGLAVNDSILLVQAYKDLRQQDIPVEEAVLRAARFRLRPIVMTTLTTILSLLPLAIGFGEAAQLRAPLAWTIIGGLAMSTIACLSITPCLILFIERLAPNRAPKRASVASPSSSLESQD